MNIADEEEATRGIIGSFAVGSAASDDERCAALCWADPGQLALSDLDKTINISKRS